MNKEQLALSLAITLSLMSAAAMGTAQAADGHNGLFQVNEVSAPILLAAGADHSCGKGSCASKCATSKTDGSKCASDKGADHKCASDKAADGKCASAKDANAKCGSAKCSSDKGGAAKCATSPKDASKGGDSKCGEGTCGK